MKPKTILLSMDASPASQNRLDLASALARRFDAHLMGLLVKPQIQPPGYAMVEMGVMLDENPFSTLENEQSVLVDKAAAAVERSFREQLEHQGVSFEWRSVVGSVPRQISLQARCADIAIVGQPDPNDRSSGDQLSVVGDILLAAGCPILVMPYIGDFPTVGERVLIAWNGSREAARAVNDALPFLTEAKSVTVLSIGPQSSAMWESPAPESDLVRHLARHGITAAAISVLDNEISIGDAILSEAADMAADLIVMGAYGHSRLRELLLGGATRSLLKTMTVPVLMSH
jgi:nucleotide-binding universal stress UspA family protein